MKHIKKIKLLIAFLLVNTTFQAFCQDNTNENQNTLTFDIAFPMIIVSSELNHPTKGRDLKDKFTEYPQSKDRFRIKIPRTNVNVNSTGFQGQYQKDDIRGFGKEIILFSGTWSKNHDTIQKLGINYSEIFKYPNATYITKGRFYVYNLPLIRSNPSSNATDNNTSFYIGKYNKEITKVEVESFYNNKNDVGTYGTNTRETKLVYTDEEYYKTTKAWWVFNLITNDVLNKNIIKITGKSKAYVGYIIAKLYTQPDIKIFDDTNESIQARKTEASMKDISLPSQRNFAIQTENNLKNSIECSTIVTINENNDTVKQSIETTILIQGPKGKKELNYNLLYGNTEADYVENDQTFLKQIDEIVNSILEVK